MNNREIEFTIDEEGNITTEAFGYKGKGCTEDIDEILKNMGRKIESRKKKDYFDTQKVRTSQHN